MCAVPGAAGFTGTICWDQNVFTNWPNDGRTEGVPNPNKLGPDIIYIGTEGGFLPKPVLLTGQPITFVTDPTAFNVGNVKDFNLFVGPAERADVLIDFSAWGGKELILYNDAPAAVPAFDPRFDYITGAPDLSANGGYGRVPPWNEAIPGAPLEGPQIGYGPNTRTVMKFRVAAGQDPNAPFVSKTFAADPGALGAGRDPGQPHGARRPVTVGVFEESQDPIIVGQADYDGVYTSNPTFPSVWPAWGISRIEDNSLMFETVAGTYRDLPHGAEGDARRDGRLLRQGVRPHVDQPRHAAQPSEDQRANMTPFMYTDPATEFMNAALEPVSPVLGDGTQLWKISHNGVDMHPIHFHIFDVQVINRVGWDGQIRLPAPQELGWKDTVRISPLEDTIVAMRPWTPPMPFSIPFSTRALNPAIPLAPNPGSASASPTSTPSRRRPLVPPTTNTVVSFAWEYVWHCHILSHEENDMMRAIVLNVISQIPPAFAAVPTVAQCGGRQRRHLGRPDAGQLHRRRAPEQPWLRQPRQRDRLPDRARDQCDGSVDRGRARRAPTRPPSRTRRPSRAPTTGTASSPSTRPATSASPFADDRHADHGRPQQREPGGLEHQRWPGHHGEHLDEDPHHHGQPPLQGHADPGRIAPAEYRFSIRTGAGAYQVVQSWSAGNIWTMPLSQLGSAAGIGYTVQVEARTSSVGTVRLATRAYTVRIPAPATAVTLTPTLASPQQVGTAVTFTAAATGGAAAKQYQFSLDGGAGFAVVRAWGTGTTWVMPATTAVGSYQVKVEVRTNSTTVDTTATVPYEIRNFPATGVTMKADKVSPALAPVGFLATGQCVTGVPAVACPGISTATGGGYSYRFTLDAGVPTAWGVGRVFTLPAGTAVGIHTIQVDVTTSIARGVDRSATMTFEILAPAAAAVSFTSVLPGSPSLVGTDVVFTALAGGSAPGAVYSYRFTLDGVPGTWSTTPTFTMLGATAGVGTHTVTVDATTEVVPTNVQATATTTHELLPLPPPPPTTVSFTLPLPASPSPAGTDVIFTAQAGGGAPGAVYSYRFTLDAGLPTAWSTTPTFTLPGASGIGIHTVTVDATTEVVPTNVEATATTQHELQ